MRLAKVEGFLSGVTAGCEIRYVVRSADGSVLAVYDASPEAYRHANALNAVREMLGSFACGDSQHEFFIDRQVLEGLRDALEFRREAAQ